MCWYLGVFMYIGSGISIVSQIYQNMADEYKDSKDKNDNDNVDSKAFKVFQIITSLFQFLFSLLFVIVYSPTISVNENIMYFTYFVGVVCIILSVLLLFTTITISWKKETKISEIDVEEWKMYKTETSKENVNDADSINVAIHYTVNNRVQ